MISFVKSFLSAGNKSESDISRFFREASSADRKKVFIKAIKKATEDQLKIMNG